MHVSFGVLVSATSHIPLAYLREVELDKLARLERLSSNRVFRQPGAKPTLTRLELPDVRYNVEQIKHIRPWWDTLFLLHYCCDGIFERL